MRGIDPKKPESVGGVVVWKKNEDWESFLKKFNFRAQEVFDNLCLIMSEFMGYSEEMGDF